MISQELAAEILRLYTCEHWPIGTLARQLKVHHSTVERVLGQSGITPARRIVRASMLEPYVPFIEETFARYPTLRASRLYQMVRERGYPGAPSHFRHLVSRYRPRASTEAYLRLRTLPGEQGQVDWAHFDRFVVTGWRRRLDRANALPSCPATRAAAVPGSDWQAASVAAPGRP